MSSITDSEWVRKSFMIPTRAITYQDTVRRELTEAKYKFTDTTLGGNFAINPPPQFSRNADIKVESRYAPSKGMGRYYSEALDDRGVMIQMRFGVPQFNSLTNFLFNFYSAHASSIANKGRSPSAFYYLGRAVGFVVSLPIMPIVWGSQVVRFLAKKPASKFYYLKPAMPLYWSAVSTMVNSIGVNMGVIGKGASTGEAIIKGETEVDIGQAEHKALFNVMANTYPNIYREDGGVDVYAMATRAQRLARVNRQNIQKALEKSESWSELKNNLSSAIETGEGSKLKDPGSRGLDAYLKSYHDANANRVIEGEDKNKDVESTGMMFENIANDEKFVNHLISELEDGSQFVTFRVDNPGGMSESFSNSVGESDIASKINGISAGARSSRFSTADFNLGDGLISGAISGIISSVKAVATGALDQLNLSGIAALGGSAFVDIPQVWQSSTASLPRASYTIELRSPYGNPMSRFQNLIVPLSMLLAGALPLSTGKQSYTSPFLVELYSKGRNQTRLGMIDSLSITRGTGNLGWTRNHEPLGIDVSFSVIDLSTILHMPISSNFGAVGASMTGLAGAVGAAGDLATSITGANTNMQQGAEGIANLLAASNFDDDNAFADYMSVLGSLGLADQIYPTNQLRLRKAQRAAEWSQWKSPAYHANWMAGTGIGQLASGLMHATNVRLD
ncbi:MAG: hypothetical protein IBX57_01095 [Gammaproteobacteria bacterium]|nr:hypothetical protein [Gammaproteobacteria bacterium]